jgi:tRNA pseudouridine55 synthase
MTCTKGTYVRTLCADIGRELGCGACLEALRRTASGSYRAENAIPLEIIRTLTRPELESRMISVRQVMETR